MHVYMNIFEMRDFNVYLLIYSISFYVILVGELSVYIDPTLHELPPAPAPAPILSKSPQAPDATSKSSAHGTR